MRYEVISQVLENTDDRLKIAIRSLVLSGSIFRMIRWKIINAAASRWEKANPLIVVVVMTTNKPLIPPQIEGDNNIGISARAIAYNLDCLLSRLN